MEDAGLALVADPVGCPAEQRAVVQLRHRRVREPTLGAGLRDQPRLHVDAVRRVVERPAER